MRKSIPPFLQKHFSFLSNFANLGFIQVSNAAIQILLFPVIIRVVGLESFGHVMVANTYAGLLSILINYGTNQSGISEVVIHKNDKIALAAVFYKIMHARMLLFVASLCLLPLVYLISPDYFQYFLFANAIVLAEVVNPLFFYIGIEKLLGFNLYNLISKLASALLIVLLVKPYTHPGIVNFYLGMSGFVCYTLLLINAIKRYQMVYVMGKFQDFLRFFSTNIYLTGNNLSVQLQQSFFIFLLPSFGDGLLLGAYTLCDKLVWSFRLLIISFSNAVFPRAVVLYQESLVTWKQFKRKTNRLLAVVFLGVAGMLILTAPLIVKILTGSNNAMAVAFIQSVCLAPLIAALNVLNVIDLLLKNHYNYIFIIALLLLLVSACTSLLFMYTVDRHNFGYYPVIVELFSLPFYYYFIRKSEKSLYPNAV